MEVVESPLVAQENNARPWVPPIQKTISTDGSGIPELAESIGRHARYLESSGDWSLRERSRLEIELDAILQDTLTTQFHANLPAQKYDQVLAQVLQRKLSPWEAVKTLMNGRPI
jgi:LAO/AO transport system kinase